MPRILDIFSAAVNNSTGFTNEWLAQFVCLVGMRTENAVELLDTYGKGYVYAPCAVVVLPDTQANRNRLLEEFGLCVVVQSDGKLVCRKPRKREQHVFCMRKVLDYKGEVRSREIANRKRMQAKRKKQERIEAICEAEELMDFKEMLRVFKDCQGEACPKRGGKANSHSDIGKYITPRFTTHMSDYERRKRKVCVIKGINVLV